MAPSIQLIVGLANPGKEYEQTRHNAGAWFVGELAKLAQATLSHTNKYQGLYAHVKLYGHDCHLLIPGTYMNLSGQSVSALATYYKIPSEAILIAHDEIDLLPGDIRLKFDGGHSGHNGLRNIIQHLHTNQFHRLRIGVGHPGSSKAVVDYVLKAPTKVERNLIDDALQNARRLLPLVMEGKLQQAMHELHTAK